MNRKRIFCIAALAVVAGCASPATHYYTLSAMPEQVAARSANRDVAIGRISVAKTLDRPQIARRAGSNELQFAEYDRWASGLDDQIRQALTDDLSAEFGTLVASSTHGRDNPPTIVSVEVDKFEADQSGTVSLSARWSAAVPDSPGGQERQENITSPSQGADSAGVARAMSEAVATLAHRIANSIESGPG
jgi:uncharacterized lipoprotein YmbA